jgi:hypothetical protein
VSRSVDIEIRASAGSHRIWIFAEDLSRSLTSSGLGVLPMAEADAVTTHLRITAIKKRNLRRCIALVEKLLDEHHMRNEVVVSEGGAEG